jgi:plastocyanin
VFVCVTAACGGGGAAVTAAATELSFVSLDLAPASAKVSVGGTVQLAAVPLDQNGGRLDGAANPTFSSSDASVAEVDTTGRVTGVRPGTAQIRAELNALGVVRSALATVEVSPPEGPALASLALSPPAASLAVGGTLRLSAVALDATGAPIAGLPAPVFRSSDTRVVSVDATGLVTAQAAGRADIHAELTVGGVTRTATSGVTVTVPLPTSAVVSTPDRSFRPDSVTLAVGGTVTWQIVERRHNITFTGPAPQGGSIPDTDEGNSVSRTFTEPGRYDYECTRHRDRGMRGTIVVVAAESPRFTSLSLAPASAAVAVGGSVQLTATPLDQNGAPVQGLPAPTFASSDPSRATVDAGGQVRGVAAGTVTITASLAVGGTTREATATITVGASGGAPGSATVTTPGSSFSPGSVTIAAGGSVTWQFTGARHNVIFRSAAPPGGNIPDTEAGNSVTRSFPAAGTYDYDCTRHAGMTGRVVVQ